MRTLTNANIETPPATRNVHTYSGRVYRTPYTNVPISMTVDAHETVLSACLIRILQQKAVNPDRKYLESSLKTSPEPARGTKQH
jgi:NAD-specific glutamate dehydrogenase